MAELTTKERIIEAIRKLPADATIEDAIERLVFLAKIDEGLAQLDSGESVPHEEVRRRFGA
jgi:predicted transcriptional regulator